MVHIDRPRHDMVGEDGMSTEANKRKLELLKRFGPSGLLTVLLLWFVLANTQSVQVSFLFISKEAPLFIVLIFTALLGALITLLMQRKGRKAAKVAKKAKKQDAEKA